MISATLRLLATRGLQGASLAEILDLAGAPRGSVYHHFPGGKDELVAEAITLAGRRALTLLDGLDGRPPEKIADRFFTSWRDLLVRSDFRAGCSVLAVTVAADSAKLIARSGAVFDAWRDRIAELFAAGGLRSEDATSRAITLIAVAEGAVVMSRAARDLAPFETIARTYLADLGRSSPSPQSESTDGTA